MGRADVADLVSPRGRWAWGGTIKLEGAPPPSPRASVPDTGYERRLLALRPCDDGAPWRSRADWRRLKHSSP